MTSPEQARQKSGGREYVHPMTGVSYPAVSTITSHVKVWLDQWHRKLAATEAVRHVEHYATLEPAAAIEAICHAAKITSEEGRRRGSAVHDVIDQKLQGEVEPIFDEEAPADVRPTFEQFERMVDELGVEVILNEVTVYNSTHHYAGTLDALARIPRLHGDGLVVLDWKTGKKVYPTAALQLAAYRHAEEITYGVPCVSRPMPEIVATYAVHLEANRWRLVPLASGRSVFDGFCSLAAFARFWSEHERNVVGTVVAAAGKVPA